MILLEELESIRKLGQNAHAVIREILDRLDRGKGMAALEIAHGHPMPPQGVNFTASGTPRIVICLAGENNMVIPHGAHGLQALVLRPGDAVFIPQDSWNYPTHIQPHSFMTVDFNPAHIRYYVHQRQGVSGNEDARILYFRKGTLPSAILQTLGALEALISDHGHGCVDTVRGLVVSLIAQVDDVLATEPETVRMSPEGKWDAVKQYLEDHLHEPLSREDVALAIKVHPNHLSRLVRRYAKQTYGGYLKERRLIRAADWLLRYNMPAYEIGRRCGFLDPTHFSRSFKAQFGSPPKTYRRRGNAHTP